MGQKEQAMDLMLSRDTEFRVQQAAPEPLTDSGEPFPPWPAAVGSCA